MSRRQYRGTDPRSFDRFYKTPLLGIDEVGTGALAGPICVAGVVLPRDRVVQDALHEAGLRDSKEMTGLTRERVFAQLTEHALWYRVKFGWCWEIEEEGQGEILRRLFTEVMTDYINDHPKPRGDILVDGSGWGTSSYQYTPVTKGDQKSQTIAAASVMAKVSRDRLMVKLAAEYPGYDFENNVGYGTRSHKEGLNRLGPCEIHRQNTKPVKRAGGLSVPKRTFGDWRG